MKRSLLLLTLLLLLPGVAGAENRALLIGIGNYRNLPGSALQGPGPDVAALRALLPRFGFTPGHITTITDRAATRRGILAAIDALGRRSNPGDRLFIYFSGHGTSSFDVDNRFNMSPYTGALVPEDFKPGDGPAMMRKLIVGTRDLRPRFAKLEQGRTLIVAVDACFSGYTVRSSIVGPQPRWRYLPLDVDALLGGEEAAMSYDSNTVPYPYSNTFYLSASSHLRKARDISTADIAAGRPSVDGRPHGAFSNALLLALGGAADGNGDGLFTANELQQYISPRVSRLWGHTPQLLKPAERSGDEPLFLHNGVPVPLIPQSAEALPVASGPTPPKPDKAATGGSSVSSVPTAQSMPPALSTSLGEPPPPAPTVGAAPAEAPAAASPSPLQDEGWLAPNRSLRLAGKNIPPALEKSLSSLDEIQLSEARADLLLQREKGGTYELYLGGGQLLCTLSEKEVLPRLQRLLRLRRIVATAEKSTRFNLFVQLQGGDGVLLEGTQWGVQMNAPRPACLLLFNIDPGGEINIITPFMEGELPPVAAVNLPGIGTVVPPGFGTELLVGLAFASPPPFWSALPKMAQKPAGPAFIQAVERAVTSSNFLGGRVIYVQTAARDEVQRR